jgi:hypothetical protein
MRSVSALNDNRLTVEQTRNAIAIAASLSAGANYGTVTKPLYAGRTAQAGVLAARLGAADAHMDLIDGIGREIRLRLGLPGGQIAR